MRWLPHEQEARVVYFLDHFMALHSKRTFDLFQGPALLETQPRYRASAGIHLVKLPELVAFIGRADLSGTTHAQIDQATDHGF